MPNLKNYTSTVSARQSISNIEHKLAIHGASSISKWFDANGCTAGLCFALLSNGQAMTYKVPANVDKVEKRFLANRSRHPKTKEDKERLRKQAERTAWKIMSDWIDIQLSLIEMDQVEASEVFLPYVFDGQETYYEYLKKNNFKQIPQLTHSPVNRI